MAGVVPGGGAVTRDHVLSEVVQIFVTECRVPASGVVPEAHVFDDLGLESIDLLTAVAEAERIFGITILDEDLGHMRRIGSMVDVIMSRIPAA
jgi:acyl carrier protein